ncbi:MAG: serine/threonine-protein kinase [Planctomycetota bacterium]
MTDGFETLHLRTPQTGHLDPAATGEFAAVRVGGSIDGYQVVSNLAEGGMGAVFRVREREGEQELALKTPLPNGRGGSYHNRMRRFLREARLTSRMNHEGVAKVRDEGQCDGLPYFTVELIDGEPLSERLYQDGVLPIVEAVSIVEKTARAAHHVHQQGVVHRDLKPANILIRPDGQPVIIDFGLARDALGIDPRITESGIWLGTPAYISPEQALGEASRVNARADVYSLGAVLYELLTGLPPFGVGSPRAIFRALRREEIKAPSTLRKLPAGLDEVVLKALARDEADRYPTAVAFANALADLLVAFEKEPPEDDLSSSGLECSWDLDDSQNGETVCGWNEPTQNELRMVSDSSPSLDVLEDRATPAVELAPAPAAPTATVAAPRRKARRARSTPARARRATGGRRRAPLRKQQHDGFTKAMAFVGPAVVAALGLLLLL